MKSLIGLIPHFLRYLYSYIVPQITHLFKQKLLIFSALGIICYNNILLAEHQIQENRTQIAQIMKSLEKQHSIPAGLLQAISKIESGHRPYAVNVAGRGMVFKDKRSALAFIEREVANGRENIDIGLMQLNWRWHGEHFRSKEEMLNPRHNIEYAAKFLRLLYNQHGSWHEAIRHYHSNKPEHNRQYSRKIVLEWLKFV